LQLKGPLYVLGVNDNVCMTPDCIKAAARIIDAMDSSVDPCHDFFEYSCGSWNRDHVIPDDRSNYDTFSKLRDDLQVILKGGIFCLQLIEFIRNFVVKLVLKSAH